MMASFPYSYLPVDDLGLPVAGLQGLLPMYEYVVPPAGMAGFGATTTAFNSAGGTALRMGAPQVTTGRTAPTATLVPMAAIRTVATATADPIRVPGRVDQGTPASNVPPIRIPDQIDPPGVIGENDCPNGVWDPSIQGCRYFETPAVTNGAPSGLTDTEKYLIAGGLIVAIGTVAYFMTKKGK